jgi:hypothetical protein
MEVSNTPAVGATYPTATAGAGAAAVAGRGRCSDSEDGNELELEGGHGSSHLLGLGPGGGDVRLKGCEGSGEVDRSSGSARGGGGHGCHGSLLLLRRSLDDVSMLTGGGGRGLDGGEGYGQVGRSDAKGGRCDGDGVEIDG